MSVILSHNIHSGDVSDTGIHVFVMLSHALFKGGAVLQIESDVECYSGFDSRQVYTHSCRSGKL